MWLDEAMTTTDIDLEEARGWIADCFEDAPDDLSDAEVIQAIQRHYDGGLAAFKEDTDA